MPKFQYDCARCTFLGEFVSRTHGPCDLYACTSGDHPTLVVRFSDEPSDNYSGIDPIWDFSFAAYGLAVERGLFPAGSSRTVRELFLHDPVKLAHQILSGQITVRHRLDENNFLRGIHFLRTELVPVDAHGEEMTGNLGFVFDTSIGRERVAFVIATCPKAAFWAVNATWPDKFSSNQFDHSPRGMRNKPYKASPGERLEPWQEGPGIPVIAAEKPMESALEQLFDVEICVAGESFELMVLASDGERAGEAATWWANNEGPAVGKEGAEIYVRPAAKVWDVNVSLLGQHSLPTIIAIQRIPVKK